MSVVTQKGEKKIQHTKTMEYPSLVSETEGIKESKTVESTVRKGEEVKDLCKLLEKMQPIQDVVTPKPQAPIEATTQPQQQASALTSSNKNVYFFNLT